MMAQSSRVDWYGDRVMIQVDEASDEMLTRLAFQAEGEAKKRAPVDTGFMRNSGYGAGPTGNHRGRAELDARGAAERNLAREPQVGDGRAFLHFAALYTVFVETRSAFIYPALQAVARMAGGMVETVGKEQFG
jgi:hypothetical protein